MSITVYSYFTRPNGKPISCKDGLTVQSAKDECDINRIIAKYQKTGVCTHWNKYQPMYGDYDAVEYQEAIDKIRSGDQMFAELPSSIRKHFDNNPAAFMAFVNDPNTTQQQLIDIGLARGVKTEEKVTQTTESTSDSTTND